MRHAAATTLCEADCAIRGRHHPDCADDTCRGCQRRTAADGLRLCVVHLERLGDDATDAPQLHRDLALVLVGRSGGGERTSGTAVSAPVPNDAIMEARIAIRALLVRLTRLIVTQRGVAAPRVRRGGLAYVDTTTDTLGPWVARHVDWLAAHEHAGQHSRDLHTAVRGPVRAMAYPAGTDRLYVGTCPLVMDDDAACGTRLYQRADQPLITCTGCGTQDTIEQWQRWVVGEAEAVTDAYAIATHLTMRYLDSMRPKVVDASLIRQWAHRGHVRPVMRPEPTPLHPDRQVPVRDRQGRVQYRVNDVIECAERLWGKP